MAIALLYGLIAQHVVTVIDGPAEQVARDQLGFAPPAAAVCLLAPVSCGSSTVVCYGSPVRSSRCLIIAMYFALAQQRDPAFEMWGITIRTLRFGPSPGRPTSRSARLDRRNTSNRRPKMHVDRRIAGGLAAAAAGEAILIQLGRTYGSTATERAATLPGDDLVANPKVVTNHAITIAAPPSAVWPWLVQMGWRRGGWYTARWVDQLLFPANGPSADRIIPELQDIDIGTFIPDGPPHTECGLYVKVLEPERALVLRSNSHLPMRWRKHANLDWTWAFVLTSLDDGQRTRFHFRSRWTTEPWWFTASGWLGIVPADFVMSRDMLRGVRKRAEQLATQPSG